MDLDALMAFVLVLVRVGSMFAFLPFLGQGLVPMSIKALTVLAISLVLAPASGVALPVGVWEPLRFLLFAASEVTLGALIGFCGQAIFKAIRTAGGMIGQQMGMALSRVADPLTGVESTVVANFCEVAGTLVFFSLNGHHWMLKAIRDSFATWPLGTFVSADVLESATVAAVARSLTVAFQLAAPLVLLTFLITLMMAVTARLVPELNILIVGFPIRIGVGLVGLTLMVPFVVRHSGDVTRMMVEFVGALAGGGPA